MSLTPRCFFDVLAGATLLVVVSPGDAHADSKQACAAAYEQAQVLRAAGKLLDARKQATLCSADTCSVYVVKDCTRWLAEIQASLPTLVFTARDREGADTVAVKVTLDGAVLGATLDGKSVAVDPGAHVVRFEMPGAPPIEQRIVAVQGEHDRKVSASFQVATPVKPGDTPSPPVKLGDTPSPPAPAPLSGARSRSVPAWAWAVGGGGVALVGVGAGFLAGSLIAQRSLDQACGGDSRHCPAQDVADATPHANTRNIDREIAVATGGAGIVGIVAGIVGVVRATPKADTPAPPTNARDTPVPLAFALTPWVAPRAGGLSFAGSF
jgi:hypothetical protein